MPLPQLLFLPDEGSYRKYYVTHYCNIPITTFDGIAVHFYPERFDHAFFRDCSPTSGDKASFDLQRAERIRWIRHVLQGPFVELFRRVMPNSKIMRIALEPTTPYVVVIQMNTRDPMRARFVTAYIVDSGSALSKMRSNPKW